MARRLLKVSENSIRRCSSRVDRPTRVTINSSLNEEEHLQTSTLRSQYHMNEKTTDAKRNLLSMCSRLLDRWASRKPWAVSGHSQIRSRQLVVAALALMILLAIPLVVMAGDPAGSATGNAGSVAAAKPGEPTTQELADAVGHANISINFVWTLVACFLVMFMQAGFALAETGFTRAKNAAHTMAMNFMCYPLGMLGFWICGFALMMGGVGAVAALGGTGPLTSAFSIDIAGHTLNIFGHKGLFLSGDSYDVGVFTLFMFAMVFMDTAVTIPTGALAERWKWGSFVFFCFFMSMWAYPVFGNWVWGGGWLSQLGTQFGLGHGHVDFAGSSVVHMV